MTEHQQAFHHAQAFLALAHPAITSLPKRTNVRRLAARIVKNFPFVTVAKENGESRLGNAQAAALLDLKRRDITDGAHSAAYHAARTALNDAYELLRAAERQSKSARTRELVAA